MLLRLFLFRVRYPDSIHLQAAGEGKIRYIEVSKVDAEQKQAKEKESFNKKLVSENRWNGNYLKLSVLFVVFVRSFQLC